MMRAAMIIVVHNMGMQLTNDHSFARSSLVALFVGVLMVGSCSSSTERDANTKQGPNPSTNNPGPNSTASDPGPNPTDAALTTLSGKLNIVGQCAQLVLDAKQASLTLMFAKDYSVGIDGLSFEQQRVAAPGARIFVTGRKSTKPGPCGALFNVTTLNSVQQP